MKLQTESVRVLFTDTTNNDKWLVEFTGDKAIIFKNQKVVAEYSRYHGHANKSTAISLIKNSTKHLKPL